MMAKSLLALPFIGLGLKSIGFRRLQHHLVRLGRSRTLAFPADKEEAWFRAQATARMVQVAARYGPYRPSCLPRALTLWWLMYRQGLGGHLRIGVNLTDISLKAHAWVEFQDRVLNDHENVVQSYPPFQTAPAFMELPEP